MRRFGKILQFELKGYFKNRIFVGTTIVLAAIIMSIMFYPRLASIWRGNIGITDDALPIMLIHTSVDEETLCEWFASEFEEYDVRQTNQSYEEIEDQILSRNVECAFILYDVDKYTYLVDNLSMLDENLARANEILKKDLQVTKMGQYGISKRESADILEQEPVGRIKRLGKDQGENFIYTYVMIFALYIVILLYGQMVATNVATEKSSRAMELLITSARPAEMMFGKVIASCFAGLIQLLIIFGSALFFYKINKSMWNDNGIISSLFGMPIELLIYMIVFFVLGFFMYAFMYGGLGSTVSKLEDINTAVMPITITFVLSFIIVMATMINVGVDSLVIRICSYIPLTSPMAMFTRIAMDDVAMYEIVISIADMIISVAIIGFISARIYRVGVLNYGTKIGLKQMLFRNQQE